MIAAQTDWIPGIDWLAGMIGAFTIAALLWVAVALA